MEKILCDFFGAIQMTVLGLQDGLGDTIRVSLTEEPEHEIDPCTKLANLGMKITKEQKGVVSPSLALDIFQLNIVLCTGQTLALYDLFWS